MLEKQYKELWETRFQKILKGEREAYQFYRRLLKENAALLSGTKVGDLLKEIMHDELKHARIAGLLLKLVKEKRIPDENHTIKESSP